MLDPKSLRNDLAQVAEGLKKRNYVLDVSGIQQLESRRREIQIKTEELQAERNVRSKAIGQAKASGQDIEPLKAEVNTLGATLDKFKEELNDIQQQWDAIAMAIPNVPDQSVPFGKDENDNVEVRRFGQPKQYAFPVKDHVDIGSKRGARFRIGHQNYRLSLRCDAR